MTLMPLHENGKSFLYLFMKNGNFFVLFFFEFENLNYLDKVTKNWIKFLNLSFICKIKKLDLVYLVIMLDACNLVVG